MALFNSTTKILLAIAFALALISFFLFIAAGLSPFLAFLYDLLLVLNINFPLLSNSAYSNLLVLAASAIDTFVFAVLAVVMVAVFFDIIKSIRLRRSLVLSRVRKMSNHVIMAPYNSFAQTLSTEMESSGRGSIVIASNDYDARRAGRQGCLAVVGDPKQISSFRLARIDRASYLIACSDDDIENAMIVVTAKAVNPNIKIISRVSHMENLHRLSKAGAYWTILPEVMAGNELGEKLIGGIVGK